jgi:N-acetyl-anhydromuramyl-L-alanine amidase AmpD
MLDRASYSLSIALLAFCVVIPSTWSYLDGRARVADVAPPAVWVEAAKPHQRFEMAGREVAYWADPNARYGIHATRKKAAPVAIVIHYTRVRPVLDVVAYGHLRDFSRGGHSYGYHFYIGRGGGIVQGAPLSRRTNHIKSSARPQRKAVARHLWSGNTIGIALIGGCDSLLMPNWWRQRGCSGEYVTRAQLGAGLAVIRALQARFDIACEEVYGHGDLQTDRARFEGATLTRLARAGCDVLQGEI